MKRSVLIGTVISGTLGSAPASCLFLFARWYSITGMYLYRLEKKLREYLTLLLRAHGKRHDWNKSGMLG